MYINKQTTVKAGFNLNSIKYFIIVKTALKNIFLNFIHIDFTIFFLQMSIQIGDQSSAGARRRGTECPKFLVFYKGIGPPVASPNIYILCIVMSGGFRGIFLLLYIQPYRQILEFRVSV